MLVNFIADFDLRDSAGVVSFSAVLHIFIYGRLTIFESDIQIITSHNLNTIYVMNVPDSQGGFPDMFDPGTYQFTYVKKECLRIKPLNKENIMMVSIFPR